jgi:hypothetical protein
MNNMTANKPNRHFNRKAVRALRSAYVATARDEKFMQQFDRLLECEEEGNLIAEPVKHGGKGETRGILVLDGAGGGKTSLVNRALSRHPALQADTSGTMPWVSVSVPSPATLKSLGFAILKETGYKVTSTRRERWLIWEMIRERFEMLGTKVLWIDEAHDLFHGGSKHEIEDMLKTIKALMQGDSAVIVILTGVSRLGQITNVDDQVRRRFSRIDLPSVTHTTDGDDLSELISSYCNKVGLFAQKDPDLVARLIHASRGRFGRCIENIINAIELALSHGDDGLCVDHFAESYAMQEACAPGHNVFLVPNWSQIELTTQEAI